MQDVISEKVSSANPKRSASIDLMKWIALMTMTVDHLKYIFPDHVLGLFLIGRWAFVFFAFVIALNLHTAVEHNNTRTIRSYVIHLMVFSIISELPYFLMTASQGWKSLNIMPTLLLGVICSLLLSANKNPWIKIAVFLLILLILLPVDQYLQYGLSGVLFIVCLYGLVQSSNWLGKILYGLLSTYYVVLSNLQNLDMTDTTVGVKFYVCLICLSLASALATASYLSSIRSRAIKLEVPAVGKWAYWFYPVHMLIIAAVSKLHIVWGSAEIRVKMPHRTQIILSVQ